MRFSLRLQAKIDLQELLEHIAKDDISAAYRVKDAVLATCSLLAGNPLIAREIEGLTFHGIRRFPVSGFARYTIFYRVNESEIEIIRLGYGGRDWENIL